MTKFPDFRAANGKDRPNADEAARDLAQTAISSNAVEGLPTSPEEAATLQEKIKTKINPPPEGTST